MSTFAHMYMHLTNTKPYEIIRYVSPWNSIHVIRVIEMRHMQASMLAYILPVRRLLLRDYARKCQIKMLQQNMY